MVLLGPPRKLVRREPLQARMRSILVEIISPLGKQFARVIERAERGLVQQLIAQPADEALCERILDRLAGLDVVPGNVFAVRTCWTD